LRNISDVTVCQLIIFFHAFLNFGFLSWFFFFLIFFFHQRSLASYIKKYACSNAKTEDLWAVLEEGSGEPVKKLMNSWAKQQGYPVVSVKVKDEKLEFEQVSFVLSFSPIFILN